MSTAQYFQDKLVEARADRDNYRALLEDTQDQLAIRDGDLNEAVGLLDEKRRKIGELEQRLAKLEAEQFKPLLPAGLYDSATGMMGPLPSDAAPPGFAGIGADPSKLRALADKIAGMSTPPSHLDLCLQAFDTAGAASPFALDVDNESKRITKQKPHKGNIRHWSKEDAPGVGLGYRIRGQFVDHPIFEGQWGHTSYVVAYDAATGEIETRNSRYKLIGDTVGDPSDE